MVRRSPGKWFPKGVTLPDPTETCARVMGSAFRVCDPSWESRQSLHSRIALLSRHSNRIGVSQMSSTNASTSTNHLSRG